jgi:hypothetical protein
LEFIGVDESAGSTKVEGQQSDAVKSREEADRCTWVASIPQILIEPLSKTSFPARIPS